MARATVRPDFHSNVIFLTFTDIFYPNQKSWLIYLIHKPADSIKKIFLFKNAKELNRNGKEQYLGD